MLVEDVMVLILVAIFVIIHVHFVWLIGPYYEMNAFPDGWCGVSIASHQKQTSFRKQPKTIISMSVCPKVLLTHNERRRETLSDPFGGFGRSQPSCSILLKTLF